MEMAELRTLEQLYDGSDAESVLTQPSNFQMEEKSQKRNSCATRRSSYMHFERVGAIMGGRTYNFTNKASQEKKPYQKSSNDGILLPHSLNCECECGQHISSEASNIASVSSHKSFSEIAESQATFRVSDRCEDCRKAGSVGESSNTPQGSIKFDNDRFSNQLDKHKGLDILGYDCVHLTLPKPHLGEYFGCLNEQEGSTPTRVAIFGFSGQIDGVYSYSTFRKDHPHLNTEDSAIKTELHLYFKRHFQKCAAVIVNNTMKG
ncbi:hypothetical protein K1719_029486 [Acacia pycnantha]|nr:hypothetical protein K1719_029486 [Acacia pycnantha]